MNVVLFAFCPSSVAYVEALSELGAPPRLVVTGPAPSPEGARAPLAEACARLGLSMERSPSVNDAAFIARLRDLPTDLLLVAGCGQILGADLRAVPRIGALNFHPSRLPAYRGREPLFWALLRGEPSVAITVHHVTAAVDGGPILLQRDVEVPDRATSASLARLVDQAGASLLPEVLALAASGALPAGVAQQGPESHFPPLRAEHGLLDFTRSAVEIDRLVRAAAGEIHAYAFHRGMRLVFVEGEPGAEGAGESPTASELPGRVVSIDADAVAIATPSGVYRVRRILFMKRVYEAPRLAAEIGIEAGAAFTSNPAF